MEKSEEQPTNLNLEAIKVLTSHHKAIMESLLALERSNPKNEVIQEMDKLGGIGAFGMCLNLISGLSQGETNTVGSSNAEFVVAYLHSFPIQKFIVEQTKGEITLTEVGEIRDFFAKYL